MRRLLDMTIRFTNLETVRIHQKYIKCINIDGIRERMRVDEQGKVKQCRACENIKIGLSGEAKKIPTDMDGVEGPGLSHRLGYPDIKEIVLRYHDGHEDLIIVPWKTYDSDINRLQSCVETSTELYITIGE